MGINTQLNPSQNFTTTAGNSFVIEFIYPEENPERYVEDITKALNYAGVFVGIKKESTGI